MRTVWFAVLTASALLCGFGSTADAQQTQTPQKQPQLADKARLDAYLAYFKEEGYKAEVDKDGDIHVKVEGKHYYIQFSATDSSYFYMYYGYNISDSEDRDLVIRAANAANHRFGLPKVRLSGKFLSYSVAAYLEKPADVKFAFPKLLANLQAVQAKFSETYAAETAALAAAKLKAAEQKKAEEKKADQAKISAESSPVD